MEVLADVANAAEYLTSDLAGFVSGQHLLVSGGALARLAQNPRYS
jgi:3-oxoacyl-[acyl-carrier protein] reductase